LPELTKDSFFNLLSEKVNKNGNIPIKDYRQLVRTLNSELVDQFFEELQNDDLIDNRKTCIHINTEAEK